MNNITEISLEKICKPCTTKTFIGKKQCSDDVKYSIEKLKKMLKNSYTTKFRNCVIKKIVENNKRKSIKLYTNLSIQISGVSTLSDIIYTLNDLEYKNNYIFECVMCNWTIRISNTNIDLNKTMDSLNNNTNYVAYFLKGCALIIKNYSECTVDRNLLEYNDKKNCFVVKEYPGYTKKSCTTVLMFKSGKCIISGLSEQYCANMIFNVKNHIY